MKYSTRNRAYRKSRNKRNMCEHSNIGRDGTCIDCGRVTKRRFFRLLRQAREAERQESLAEKVVSAMTKLSGNQ